MKEQIRNGLIGVGVLAILVVAAAGYVSAQTNETNETGNVTEGLPWVGHEGGHAGKPCPHKGAPAATDDANASSDPASNASA